MKFGVFLALLVVHFYTIAQQYDANDHVILVQLELNEKLLLPSYWNSYEIENKRIMLHLSDDEPLADIEAIEDEEDNSYTTNCFIPNLKLIYKDFTYLISSLCNKVRKFENIRPFEMGEKELPCSLTYSADLSRSLEKYQAIFFGPTYKSEYNTFVQKNSSKIAPDTIGSGTNSNLNTNKSGIEEEKEDAELEETEANEEIEEKEEFGMGFENQEEEMDDEDEDIEEEDLEEDEEDMPKKKRR